MKKIASNELKKFLQDWLDWAEGGAEDDYKYIACCGLCGSTTSYYDNIDEIKCARIELRKLFHGVTYPFGEENYDIREYRNTQHQDPNRLAWVRAALNDTLDTWELIE